MDDQSCQTPARIGLFSRLIRIDCPESTKRAQLIWATWTLVIAVLGIAGSIIYRIKTNGDVGNGAVAAFVAATGPLAALAGVSYRKPETTP